MRSSTAPYSGSRDPKFRMGTAAQRTRAYSFFIPSIVYLPAGSLPGWALVRWARPWEGYLEAQRSHSLRPKFWYP